MTVTTKPFRPKTCKFCKAKFTPVRQLQQTCLTVECAYGLARINGAKKSAKQYRATKERLKTRQDWLKEAQAAFNRYIRIRDRMDGCISCDRPASWHGQWHASHYYATSIRPNLRFNENNVHKSCSICNNYMHGNLTPYRKKLIIKIGIDAVNVLDSARELEKLTAQDLQDIKVKYAKLTKEIINTLQD